MHNNNESLDYHLHKILRYRTCDGSVKYSSSRIKYLLIYINAEGSTDQENLTFIFWKGFLSVLYISAHFTIVAYLKYQVYIVAIFKIVIKLEHKTRKKLNFVDCAASICYSPL